MLVLSENNLPVTLVYAYHHPQYGIAVAYRSGSLQGFAPYYALRGTENGIREVVDAIEEFMQVRSA